MTHGERYARLRAACADGSPVDPDRQAALVELDLATKARAIAVLRLPSPQTGGGNGGGESRAAGPPISAGLAVAPPAGEG